MRNWILGGFLACFTSAGVAYVLARNTAESHCGACVEKPAIIENVILPPMGRGFGFSSESCEHCGKCSEGSSKVVDVVDLDRSFLKADGTPKPAVSFEEPPLAKPRGEVTPVKFEVPVQVEIAPMPRAVETESETFKQIREYFKRITTFGSETSSLLLPTPHYLKHYSEYFPPAPVFPLQIEMK